jgi:uncharacterized membrane protein YraQ (UPF0718 family)
MKTGQPENPETVLSVRPSCCGSKPAPVQAKTVPSCCDTDETGKPRADWLFWIGLSVVSIGYLAHVAMGADPHAGHGGSGGLAGAGYSFGAAIFELMNIMWIGIVAGIIAMGFLSRVPRDFVMAALGSGRGVQGVFRAAFAGVLLDLCSHGILMVGAKFYERGATIGQVMAFLIASPWNSLSLTLVLIALIGLKWTLVFIVVSMVIGIVTGILFDHLVARGVLPPNPNHRPLTTGFQFWPAAKKGLAEVKWTPRFVWDTLVIGIKDSKMIVRWLFVGVIIAAALRAGVSADMFAQWFGPTMLGLGATLVAATIIEVCSEGAAPIAGDLFGRAGAIGNSFTFLMAGVATDYTEIMVLREATKSWKIALFLPLLTVPQVLVVGYLMNQFGG